MRKSYKLTLFAALSIFCSTLFLPNLARAEGQISTPSSTSNAGLTISPVRSNPTMAPGENRTQKLTVENRSARRMNIALSYERFSVTNETYEYTFAPVANDVITFETDHFSLEPGTSKSIAYKITIPAGASAGGEYYTIFATSTTTSGSITTKSRVGSMLFITVDGPLDRSTTITHAEAPNFTVAPHIPVTITLQNVGNVHSENTVTTRLDGPFMSPQTTTALHVVLPATTRVASYSIPSPRLPGIYTITITANNGNRQTPETTLQVVYVPIWIFALGTLLLFLVGYIVRRSKHRRSRKAEQPSINV